MRVDLHPLKKHLNKIAAKAEEITPEELRLEINNAFNEIDIIEQAHSKLRSELFKCANTL